MKYKIEDNKRTKERDHTMEWNIDATLNYLKELTAIDSPDGFTREVIAYTRQQLERLGFQPTVTNKGCIVCEIGGTGEPIVLAAHIDTLGAQVAEIKSDGRLRLSPVGGLPASVVETENCRIYTRDGGCMEGTFQLVNASLHVNGELSKTVRDYDNMELVLDEDVKNKEEVEALGISNGCYVCFDPRTVVTASGYIKSRYLDDKLSVAMLLSFAEAVSAKALWLKRKVYLFISVYEEVGHGACAGCPEDVVEFLSVDMGCVGQGLACTEKMVSICAKDSGGPYDYDVVNALVACAEAGKLDYAVDIYPHYGSDAEAALSAGVDARHGLIGAGVYASHGYERSHVKGVENTLKLLEAYLGA